MTRRRSAAQTGDSRSTTCRLGTYELRVWHEALKGAPQKVTVSAGKPTEVSLQLK